MELSTAISLIQKPFEHPERSQTWADLGAGGGLFTTALATLLGTSGKIFAVDKDHYPEIKSHDGMAEVVRVQKDFISDDLGFHNLDGILIANALHYVNDKKSYLLTLSGMIKKSGKLIVVEYDTLQSNTWVPYPLSFDAFTTLAEDIKIGAPVLLGQVPSRYHGNGIYAALVNL